MSTEKAVDYPVVKFGPFWVRKLRTLFRSLDADGCRRLQLDDFIEVANSLIASSPKMTDFKEDELVKGTVDLWYGFVCSHVEEHARTMAYVTEAKFIDNIQNVLNTSLREKFADLLVKSFFQAVDADDDGKITYVEFLNIVKAWRGSERDSDPIFKAYDKDKDGKITADEYHALIAQYFYSEEPRSVTAKLWGNLVSYKRPEDYGVLQLGPFWEGKIRTMFRRLDVSGTGVLRCHDFIQIAKAIIQRGHLQKKKADSVMKCMLELWIKYIAVDKEGRHFAEISETEFIHNMRAMINSDYRHDVDQFGWTFYKAVEGEGNGHITLQEYRNLQEAWKVSRDEAAAMFKVLDTDKDGKISSEEYMTAFLDYFLGEDSNSPFKSFFGPCISRFD